MEIRKNIEIVGLGLKVNNNLVITDLHLGYEESLNKQGVMIPRFQFDEIMKHLKEIFKIKNRFEKIIINGDLTNEFGSILNQEWRHTLQLLDFLAGHCGEVIVIKGNHDTMLTPITKKRGVKVLDQYIDKDILFIHGDDIVDIPREVKTIIIGHEHPAVTLKDRSRTELFKCFLVGEFDGRELIVLPSFHFVTEGHDVLKEEVFSPYLEQNLDNFRVIIVDDKVYDFGRVRDIS